ncbi:MAG: cupin domain-containing protein [Verrucomicrobiota bacterium]|nr:cupin domain-containing protein [Verrucomicrobiota bacterium]
MEFRKTEKTKRAECFSILLAFFRPRDWTTAMFQYVSLAQDKSWQPGPYDGVELMILHKSEVTGGLTVLRKFKEGATIPAHIHPQANEFAYILSGQWEESGTIYSTGTFFLRAER